MRRGAARPRMPLSRYNSLAFRLTGTLILTLALLLAVTAVVQIGLQGRFSRECSQAKQVRSATAIPAALAAAAISEYIFSSCADMTHRTVRQRGPWHHFPGIPRLQQLDSHVNQAFHGLLFQLSHS